MHLGGKENENVLTYIKIELQMPKTQRTPSKVLEGFTVRAGAHMVPSPKSQATWGQSIYSQPFRAWKLRHTTSHGGPKSWVSSMTWMPAWDDFLEARLETCVGLGTHVNWPFYTIKEGKSTLNAPISLIHLWWTIIISHNLKVIAGLISSHLLRV